MTSDIQSSRAAGRTPSTRGKDVMESTNIKDLSSQSQNVHGAEAQNGPQVPLFVKRTSSTLVLLSPDCLWVLLGTRSLTQNQQQWQEKLPSTGRHLGRDQPRVEGQIGEGGEIEQESRRRRSSRSLRRNSLFHRITGTIETRCGTAHMLQWMDGRWRKGWMDEWWMDRG